MKYGRNKGPVQGIHTNGFSTLVRTFLEDNHLEEVN